MIEDLCSACGGDEFIDETQAARLGVALGDARTAICPRCHGVGVEPPRLGVSGFIAQLVAIAFASVAIGAVVALVVLSAPRP